MSTLTPQTAAWIRDHVLTEAVRSSVLSAAEGGLCACQWGTCGACAKGRHDRCPYQTPLPMVETCLVNQRGFVAFVEDDSIDPSVWLADRTCAYRCPCPERHGEGAPVRTLPGDPPSLTDPAHGDQLHLFALGGAA